MRFTPYQEQAIRSRSRELLVSAAAGSGKTAVLVERILQMIAQDGLSIEKMLIVTFTRAAASEMRERLETRLSDAAQGDARLLRQADLVSAAQISTIHSFCQKVVREHFQHCQIDPQFGLCDERTRAAFYQESMEETLDALYQQAHNDEEINALVRKFAERDLVPMLDQLYRFLMSRPDPMEWLDKHANHAWSLAALDEEPVAITFCREASLIVDGMLSLIHRMKQEAENPAFPGKYRNTLQSDEALARDLSRACTDGITSLIRQMSALKFSRLPVVKPQSADEAALCEAFKQMRERCKDMADEIKKLLPADAAQSVADLQSMQPAARGLAKAVKLLHEIFSQKKREQAVIDFNDLEHMTLSILNEPALRHQLCQRFDAIFVDEYQDVSELQEAILNGLKRAPENGQKQYAFYVGDVKQSIYRFRLAEPGLFLRKLASFSPEEEAEERRIVLNRNFRSRCGVLDAVNRVFDHVMDSRVTEIDYDEDARLYPGAPSVGDEPAEVHILNSQGKRPQDMVLCEAEWIARDILARVGQPILDNEGNECGLLKFSDIAVLLPVSKNIADKVELVFTRAGIPVHCDQAADVLGADEIQQMVQYLTVLDNLMNDVALLSVLRSPLFEMTESELSRIRLMRPSKDDSFLTALMAAADEAQQPLRTRAARILDTLRQERFLLGSMPLSDYLWSFLSRSGLYAHYGAQPGGKLRQANLRMLCSRAAEYEQTHTDGLHGFVESLAMEGPSTENSPTVLNPWENVVRVMTIHKSKGLEFPTVYVMNLGRSLFGRAQSRALCVHGEAGFGLEYVNEEARTRRSTLLQGAITLLEKNAARAERARVLYVAMTRPKSRLVLLGSMNTSGMDAAALRKAAQNGSDAYAVRSAHSMLDWVLQSALPEDEILETDGLTVSTKDAWKTSPENQFSTIPTGFPQKSSLWRIVFHIDPSVSLSNAPGNAIEGLHLPIVETEENIGFASAAFGENQHPGVNHPHLPLKVGVTALCRAMELGTDIEEEEESAQTKRFPLMDAQPRLLSSLPGAPAFLEPPKEEHALQKGVQTHRLLGLISLDAVRPVCEKPKALYAVVCSEVERLVNAGVVTPKEAEWMDRGMAARFLESDLGKRMLKSETVLREWPFNLRIEEPFPTMVQGVIDLCFLEEGQWVLVDFKTDRVNEAKELWPRYRRQLAFYRQALETATPCPVRLAAVYALRLGESYAENDA